MNNVNYYDVRFETTYNRVLSANSCMLFEDKHAMGFNCVLEDNNAYSQTERGCSLLAKKLCYFSFGNERLVILCFSDVLLCSVCI